MSSIDDRGRRAGADLRRAAGHHAGPPLSELTARRRTRVQRSVAAGAVVVVLAGGVWSITRLDPVREGVDVTSTGPAADPAATDEVRRPVGRDDVATPQVTPEDEATGPSDIAPSTSGPSAPTTAPTSTQPGGQPSRGPATTATAAPSGATSPGGSLPADPDAPDPTPTTTPSTTTPPTTTPPTTPPVVGPPTGPLTPSSPAWAPACAAADELLELAWAVDAGTSDDMFGVALAFIRTVRAVPDGVAPAEVAYTEQLIRSIEQYIRVAPLAGDFVQNVEVLTLEIGRGCGTPDGLPLPTTTVPRMYSLVFESGVF